MIWQKCAVMTRLSHEQMVRDYFRGVDEENLDLIFSTLADDCVFSVETHGVSLTGHDAIRNVRTAVGASSMGAP